MAGLITIGNRKQKPVQQPPGTGFLTPLAKALKNAWPPAKKAAEPSQKQEPQAQAQASLPGQVCEDMPYNMTPWD